MKKTIMIYSDFLFENDIRYIASTGRFINLAQVVHESGRPVTIYTYTKKESPYQSVYEGLLINYIPYQSVNKFNDFFKSGTKFLEVIDKQENLNDFDTVIYYGTSLKFTKPIKTFSKKFNLNTVSLVNEWGSMPKKIKSMPNYMLQKMGIYYVQRYFSGVVSISSFMDDYFNKKNTKSLIIPSVFDFDKLPDRQPNRLSNNPIVISYAGTIANGKDSMAVILRALNDIREDIREKVVFNLYGSTQDQVQSILHEDSDEILRNLQDIVVFKGHFERGDLQSALILGDFGILIRPNEVYANAGFPTKFAESMALGVPMIANATSDIAKYLVNEKNGYLLKDDKLETLKDVFIKIISLSDEAMNAMRTEAYDTAQTHFNYKGYIESMIAFLSSL